MNGFERRKENKKESIRRAALELFKYYGFEKVTINDIARHAGASQVTIYNHFGSKEELVREVIKTLLQNILEEYKDSIRRNGSFIEKLEDIVFDKIEMLNQFQGELIQNIIRTDPQIRQFVDSMYWKEFNELTIELFNEGRKEGYVDRELSDDVILFYLEILRRGVFATSSLAKKAQDAKLSHELMKLFRYGLVGKKWHSQ